MKNLYILPDNDFLSAVERADQDSHLVEFMKRHEASMVICEPVMLVALDGIRATNHRRASRLREFYEQVVDAGAYIPNDLWDLELLSKLRTVPALKNFDGYREVRSEKDILKKASFAISRGLTIVTSGKQAYLEIDKAVTLCHGVYDAGRGVWIAECRDEARRRLVEGAARPAPPASTKTRPAYGRSHAMGLSA